MPHRAELAALEAIMPQRFIELSRSRSRALALEIIKNADAAYRVGRLSAAAYEAVVDAMNDMMEGRYDAGRI